MAEKEEFFVVRKGDLVGVYKSLSDCQAQVGTSVCDPPVSVYKGCSMPQDTESYLRSHGLKNASYSINASDLTQELFGTLVPFPFKRPSSSRSEAPSQPAIKKLEKDLSSNYGLKQRSCTLEFDGASKGNPGQAGAGAILRYDDGSLICRLCEGLGIATCNFAEYKGVILGLKYAAEKGFTNIRVKGDSKLVCMQIQGLWRVKSENLLTLYKEAKELEGRFRSFQIMHVLRDLNSEADVQANLGARLAEGDIQEDFDT
ncbi:RNase H family protein [Perilla frutescens var. frutescens]|nr:RNase H family protein [Perilla frutescens var. frutescens]